MNVYFVGQIFLYRELNKRKDISDVSIAKRVWNRFLNARFCMKEIRKQILMFNEENREFSSRTNFAPSDSIGRRIHLVLRVQQAWEQCFLLLGDAYILSIHKSRPMKVDVLSCLPYCRPESNVTCYWVMRTFFLCIKVVQWKWTSLVFSCLPYCRAKTTVYLCFGQLVHCLLPPAKLTYFDWPIKWLYHHITM